MSPLKIDILLWYHSRHVDYSDLVSSAHQEAICYFLNNGYLIMMEPGEEFDMSYKPTEKLHFYVEALCNVPEPVQEWVIPNKANT